MPADIVGVGISVPDKVLTNADLEKMVDTSDEWIVTRTGIKERRVVGPDTNVSDLAAEAGLAAIRDSGLNPEEIDLVMVATGSPEMIWPSTACLAQAKMKLSDCAAFDIQAACTSFVYGLTTADALLSSGAFKNILLIGAETISRFVNWKDRNTCVLFGDGAGAVVLQTAEEGFGVLSSYLSARGSGAEMLKIPAGGSGQVHSAEAINEDSHTIKMRGSDVFRFALKALPESVEEALKKADLGIEDVDYFIPHQANQRIIEAAIERLGLPEEKVVVNIAEYGNTSAASIPLALEDIYSNGQLKRGDVIVLAAFGAGLTWGANVIRWGGRRTS
ncbi:MAG TPA: ketoacyl-ACP synthase III [Actinobacteria bacterium]|nr:ketoacyl-ACP synthase III [Actinomycetota bacterium]